MIKWLSEQFCCISDFQISDKILLIFEIEEIKAYSLAILNFLDYYENL